MNSTLRSLVFWMVLVVIGALVWHLSTTFKKPATELTFSDFVNKAELSQIAEVTITGDEITGKAKDDDGQGTWAGAAHGRGYLGGLGCQDSNLD